MNLHLTSDEIAFQREVRSHFDRRIPPEMRQRAGLMTSVYARRDVMDHWQKVLHERGWGAPSWPVAFEGCDWTPAEHFIFACEKARAGAPPFLSLSVIMCGAVITAFGTQEQKECFLPRMISGEDYWCQGYSEPGSGSDLAALSMSAVEDGNDLVCNGTKIWTSHAHEADWMYCLVRSESGVQLQRGITFLLVDMRSPGIEVHPIVFLTGEHIQNEVVFHNVRVPRKNVIGQICDGWAVAKYLMEFERGGQVRSPEYEVRLDHIADLLASQHDGCGMALIDALGFATRVAAARVDLLSLQGLEIQTLQSSKASPGTDSSTLKILGTELSQRLTELELEATAFYAQAYQPMLAVAGGETPWARARSADAGIPAVAAAATLRYFNDRACTIYAGSNEIQRNILAKRRLGL